MMYYSAALLELLACAAQLGLSATSPDVFLKQCCNRVLQLCELQVQAQVAAGRQQLQAHATAWSVLSMQCLSSGCRKYGA
jgi:hypothetical protein